MHFLFIPYYQGFNIIFVVVLIGEKDKKD